MSAPFGGTSSLPYAERAVDSRDGPSLDDDLAALDPPRKHYQRYYQTREANENMWHAPQGIAGFIRGYYHYKSADWDGNRPHPLAGPVAAAMAEMPTYYVMERDKGMAETVAAVMPSPGEIAANRWLPDANWRSMPKSTGAPVSRVGCNGIACGRPRSRRDCRSYAGRRIEQPSMFIAGGSDWGIYQSPGAVDRMQEQACSDMKGVHLIPGAGHWVQQEQPEATVKLVLAFLERNRT